MNLVTFEYRELVGKSDINSSLTVIRFPEMWKFGEEMFQGGIRSSVFDRLKLDDWEKF